MRKNMLIITIKKHSLKKIYLKEKALPLPLPILFAKPLLINKYRKRSFLRKKLESKRFCSKDFIPPNRIKLATRI